MTYDEIGENADRLRRIPLEAVLRLTGAVRDRSDKAKWHSGRGTLSVNRAKFTNWQRGESGGGAIDLVMHLCCLDFKEAVEWLWFHFRNSPGALSAQTPPPHRSALRLPHRHAGNISRVLHYLEKDRCLPAALTRSLVASGSLYADSRGNAVFLLLGKEKMPVGAELRSATTAARWRGMAPGSKKDLGYFSVSADRVQSLVLCESAIDAMSFVALHSGCRCISTSGARHNPAWLAELIDHGHDIYCAFDSDQTGDAAAATMIHSHPVVRRLRPPLHDWNDVLKSRFVRPYHR